MSRHAVVLSGVTWHPYKRRVIVGRCTARHFWVSHVFSRRHFDSACSNEGNVSKQCPSADILQPWTRETCFNFHHAEWCYCYTVTCLGLTTNRQFSQQSENSVFLAALFTLLVLELESRHKGNNLLSVRSRSPVVKKARMKPVTTGCLVGVIAWYFLKYFKNFIDYMTAKIFGPWTLCRLSSSTNG